MVSRKIEIEKIYKLIDKIAKKGKDAYVEYVDLIDELISKRKYDIFKQCLLIKYKFESENIKFVSDLKKDSWKPILFQTNTSFQESKYSIMKENSIFQNGIFYYREIPRTKVVINSSRGSGGSISPIIEDGRVVNLTIDNQGSNYSPTASIIITGGLMAATASLEVRGGRLYSTDISSEGSYHNKSPKLGIINELDEYEEIISDGTVSSDGYQKFTRNKTTKLEIILDGSYDSVIIDNWNDNWSYDKNMINLYKLSIPILLSRLDQI